MKKEEITSMEIMEMLVKFSEHMDERFERIEERFERIDQRFEMIEQRFDQIDNRLDYHQAWFERIEKNMATRDQFNSLVGILRRKDLISEHEAAHATI